MHVLSIHHPSCILYEVLSFFSLFLQHDQHSGSINKLSAMYCNSFQFGPSTASPAPPLSTEHLLETQVVFLSRPAEGQQLSSFTTITLFLITWHSLVPFPWLRPTCCCYCTNYYVYSYRKRASRHVDVIHKSQETSASTILQFNPAYNPHRVRTYVHRRIVSQWWWRQQDSFRFTHSSSILH